MTAYPDNAEILLKINTVRVGLVLSCRERRTVELQAVGAINQNTAVTLVPTTERYVITLRRIIPDGALLANGMNTETLHSFMLDIVTNGKTVRYTGCEFASLTTLCEADISVIEEAEIHAVARRIL